MAVIDLFLKLVDIVLHVDRYLAEIISAYGMLTYAILFVVVFCETGLVVTPFLPGDSLLFTAGALAALGSINVYVVFAVLCAAAIIGDTVNYWIGHIVGPKVFAKENVRFLNKKHLDRTHRFYEKYGGKTIILARFMPFIRTFAPFVAGIGSMSYGSFLAYNVVGGVAWVAICVFAGYFFGNVPIVKRNFGLVIIAIIIISVMPAVVEYVKYRLKKRKERPPIAG